MKTNKKSMLEFARSEYTLLASQAENFRNEADAIYIKFHAAVKLRDHWDKIMRELEALRDKL